MPGERNRTREALVEEAAERVDVGAPVDVLTANLLRCRVVDGAEQLPVGRPSV